VRITDGISVVNAQKWRPAQEHRFENLTPQATLVWPQECAPYILGLKVEVLLGDKIKLRPVLKNDAPANRRTARDSIRGVGVHKTAA